MDGALFVQCIHWVGGAFEVTAANTRDVSPILPDNG